MKKFRLITLSILMLLATSVAISSCTSKEVSSTEYTASEVTLADVTTKESEEPNRLDNLPDSGKEYYHSESLSYIDTDKYILLFDSDIDIPSDIISTIDLLITNIENETGLTYYNENTQGDKDKFTIYLTSSEDDIRKAVTLDNKITLYSPYFDTNEYGVSILTHELTHMILFHNLKVNSLTFHEGTAEFYGDKICRSLVDYPVFYESYEYGTGVIQEGISPATAEDLFLSDLKNCTSKRAAYQYGNAFFTFMYETYGEKWFAEFIESCSNYDLISPQDIVSILNSIYDDHVFAKFGLWFKDNMERFRYKPVTDSDLCLYDY